MWINVHGFFEKNFFSIQYLPIYGVHGYISENLRIKDEINNDNEESDFDFYDDESLQKFLDDEHALSEGYEIPDLVAINSDFTTNKSSNFSLRKEAATAFELMAWAFSNNFDFKARFTINSARRSQSFQRQLAKNCAASRCAKPWTSEHNAWLAIDLWVNGGNIQAWSWIYFQWMKDNAHLYWFHNSYQKWIDIDGKMVEPWHRRYLGVELATKLYERQQSFTEYFYENVEEEKIDDIEVNKEKENITKK